MTRPTTHGRQSGFTLIETLVALAILGIVLSTVFGIFGSGLRAAHRDEDRLLLALVAENLLARSRLDLFPGEGGHSGDIGGGLRWRIDGEPYVLPEDLLPEAPREEPDLLGRGEEPGGTDRTAQPTTSGRLGEGLAGSDIRTSLDRETSTGGLGQDRSTGGLGQEDSTGRGEESGDAAAGRDGERAPEREKVRLRLVTVTVEKGGERFQLRGLAPEPRRDRSPLR